MTVTLTKAEIDAALPKVAPGLQQYLWLQASARGRDQFHDEAEFRRRYNHFYRVRRAVAWQRIYFGLMADAKHGQLTFHAVLALIWKATGRYESSFASKLLATLNPSKPVIDSVVLRRLGLRLPSAKTANRSAAISLLHRKLETLFADFLGTDNGKYLVDAFDSLYPRTGITNEKKLDFVLWQSRG
ncbi:MAG: hypothetical protein ACT4NL_17260 [Pseudomarimonas sp.]